MGDPAGCCPRKEGGGAALPGCTASTARHAEPMAANEPSVIVNPPVDGRRVTISGTYYGSARDMKELEQFLWLAGSIPHGLTSPILT